MSSSRFQCALITGASSGLGEAIARDLARRGTHVLLVARRAEELERVAREIRAAGGRAESAALDVRDAERVRDLIRELDLRAGGFDLVLANAGVGRAKPVHELTWDEIDETLAVNVRGAIATLHGALPLLRARGRGTLAGMSSLAGLRGLPTSAVYSASKAALSTYLESLAIDLTGSGVRVCDIRPGFVRTPMTAENRFPMPFLMDAQEAARRAVRGLEEGRAIVAFPRPMRLAMALAERVPSSVYRWIARRLPTGEGPRSAS